MINPPQVLPEEPTAVTPHGGICGGKSQRWLSYPTRLHVRICEGASSDRRLYSTLLASRLASLWMVDHLDAHN